jgi:hypothetical protein
LPFVIPKWAGLLPQKNAAFIALVTTIGNGLHERHKGCPIYLSAIIEVPDVVAAAIDETCRNTFAGGNPNARYRVTSGAIGDFIRR